MIGLDTNILVRYLAQDDMKQSAIVTSLIEDQSNKDGNFYINQIVLCELVWVLQRSYKISKKQTIEIIEKLLHTKQFTLQSPNIIWKILKKYKTGNADFADYMTGLINIERGCAHTLSFDKKALKGGDFVLPSINS